MMRFRGQESGLLRRNGASMEPGTRPTGSIQPTSGEKWVRATRPRRRPCLAGRECTSVRPVAASPLAIMDMGWGGEGLVEERSLCSHVGHNSTSKRPADVGRCDSLRRQPFT